jgi:hypothetical protein
MASFVNSFRTFLLIALLAALGQLAALSQLAAARESEQRKVSSFDGIRASGNLVLFIEEGSQESLRIEVEGVELDRVVSEVSENSLTVRAKPGVYPEKYEIKVYVTYRKLRDIRAASAARLYGQSVLSGDRINVEVVTSALAELEVQLENLVVTVASAGELTITGRARTQETTINMGGKLNAFDLDCENAYVRVNTGGAGRVKATKLLEANVGTGGSLRYKGKPAKQSIKKSTGGAVSEILE